jgi:hypothetical protein
MADLGRSVTYMTASRSTSNITGSETISYSSSSISALVLKQRQKTVLDPEGIIENGDAYIMTADFLPLQGDRVVVDGETFQVTPSDRSMVRHVGDSVIYYFSTLHKVEGTQS